MSERLLLDMDGVIADTVGGALEIVQAEQGISLCHADVEDYWFSGLPIEPRVLTDILRRERFYRGLQPITGAVRAINRLRMNYEVVVCTAPMRGAERCETEKREWLAEYFDEDFAEQAIVTNNKRAIKGRVLVEDNPDVDARPAHWRTVMFDQAWNRHRTDLPRMNGWHDLSVIERTMK